VKYRRLLPYILRRWPALLAILVLTAGFSLAGALQPWPMKVLVDHALGSAPLPPALRQLLEGFPGGLTPGALVVAAAVASVLLFFLNSVLDVALSWVWTATGQRLVYDLAADLFRRLQRLSLLFHSRRSVGDSLSRLTGDSWCVYTVADSLLISPAQHGLTLVSIGAVAWSLDPRLTLVAFSVTPLLAVSALVFGNRLKDRTKQSREVESRLMAFVHQTLASIPVVQAFGTEQRNGERFRVLAGRATRLSQQGNLLKSAFGLINGSAVTASTAVVLWIGGVSVLRGELSLGSLLVFLAYLKSIHGGANGLIKIYGTLKTVEPSLDRLLEVLDSEEQVREAPAARPLAPPPPGRGAHVRLEAVSFGYSPDRPVLREVTLEARPGETVALVGQTGAGKSTLVSLIPRFFDPWQGRVLFDGVDVREVQLQSLRAQVSLVLQEPFLLPLTIAENIAYGRPGASAEEIRAAAVAANAHTFIERLPQGYDTVIGERGATLSGGEKQRLSIARALLKDAPVLILDEPTSALDVRTEGLLLEALERLMAGRTTFIIAHRLSTIRRADRIVVIEEGRVVEQGSHAELLQAHGTYHQLHDYYDVALKRTVAV
jgi:ATP-binding cassette, subfamily B, bacterial